MSDLDFRIEKLREEMYILIDIKGIQSEDVLKKSHEIDKLIVVKQMQQGGNNGKMLF